LTKSAKKHNIDENEQVVVAGPDMKKKPTLHSIMQMLSRAKSQPREQPPKK
jgi:hypothetical protein